MIEAGANEIPEDQMIEAIYKCHDINQTAVSYTHLDTNDDIELTGTLIDHLDIDVSVCQGGKNSSRRSAGRTHAPSHNGD